MGQDDNASDDYTGSRKTTTFVTVAVASIAEEVHPLVAATLTVLTGGESGRLIFVGEDGAILGRGKSATYSFPEESISRQHVRLTLADGQFWVRDLGSLNGTYVDGKKVEDSAVLPTSCRVQIATHTVMQFQALDELGAAAVRKLSKTITTDPLTGTGNRHHLQERLDQEVHYAQRHEVALGALLLDLDHFKHINDQCGHLAGDRVLQTVGELLLLSVRAEDAVFRFGGEEFCVLVRGTDAEGLLVLAERIRAAIERTRVTYKDFDIQVTTSIGAAILSDSETGDDEMLLLRADKALYEAKEQGRNRVILYREK